MTGARTLFITLLLTLADIKGGKKKKKKGEEKEKEKKVKQKM